LFAFHAQTDIYSDTRARISVIEDNLKDVPCDQLAAFVIYDLPGRDCAAKASNGELAAGDITTYKTEYIDRKHSRIIH
jgi:cellulose 1,4-beta-cellobiosidase